jgi:phosphoenolpyruvate-protein phosphotransferase (PTS system enzyme I)
MTDRDPRDEADDARERAVVSGTGVSGGFGMGAAWIVTDPLTSTRPARRIAAADVPVESARLRAAVAATRGELDESGRRVEEQFSQALAGIFRAHAMMLDGILNSGELERELESLVAAEAAVRHVFRRWTDKFRSLKEPAFQQRADDVADLGRRILRRLQGHEGSLLDHVPRGSVLVLGRLLPSDVVGLAGRGVTAVVVEALAPGSHAALLAREKRLPTVAALPGIVERVRPGDELLVDGYRGTVIVAPDAADRLAFDERRETYERTFVRCHGLCREPAFTLDHARVFVGANLGAHDDVALAIDNGADGVGLFRIEQLYLARMAPPTDDELYEELRAVVAPLRDAPVTVRLLDVGGDKPLPFLPFAAEANPSLGRRGVRVLREYPELARTQLRALLRLAAEQDVRILVPMVTLEEDVRAIRALFDAVLTTLPLARRPPFGAMIETPAAALSVAAIAPHVDFLSVGTNDLTQYTLAAGRDDPAVSDYYVDTHAAVLRLLGIAIADAAGVPVTLCGELAGRPELIPELLRLGFRSLSMAPELIPAAKDAVRGVRLAPAA